MHRTGCSQCWQMRGAGSDGCFAKTPILCSSELAATGGGGIEAVYADASIWLTQKMLAQLYDVDVRTINYHLTKVFSDSELEAESVIRNFRITASDGKNYNTQHYKLPAISDCKAALGQPDGLAELTVFYCEQVFDFLAGCGIPGPAGPGAAVGAERRLERGR